MYYDRNIFFVEWPSGQVRLERAFVVFKLPLRLARLLYGAAESEVPSNFYILLLILFLLL